LLALGADGVWVGTRFVACEESEAHAEYKKRLLEACETDAVYTEIFHVGWPPNSPHRVLRNSLTDGGSAPSGPVASVRFGDRTVEVPPFGSATPTIHTEGYTELMANYAGQGVGLIHNVLPAAEIVEQIVSEAQGIIRRLPTMLA
jgi:nitronate monooxygenase